MQLIRPSFEIVNVMQITSPEDSLILIESAGRTCYKSKSELSLETAKEFIQKLNDLGHDSVIEHSAMMVKFICDRGVSHELVRHRLCSFSQESTRYCNYKGGVTFIIPPWIDIGVGTYESTSDNRLGTNLTTITWYRSVLDAEWDYKRLLDLGWSPQQARSILPNSLKTEIVMTTNFREWKHIFKLRCSKASHPQMREIMIPLFEKCKGMIPIIFDDISY